MAITMLYVDEWQSPAPVLGNLSKDLISKEELVVFQWVVYVGLLTVISTFGMVTNIINIICFTRQDVQDSVNVSLTGLAISDFGCLVTQFLTCVIFNPALEDHFAYKPLDVAYMVTGWPHIVFTGLSAWLTALITLERCLCIAMPLKVKNLITKKRVTIIIACIFTVFTACVIPAYYAYRLDMVFIPEINRTGLGLKYAKDRDLVDSFLFVVVNTFIPFSAFLTITICTITLVVKLRSKTLWRMKCATAGGDGTTSSRDQRVSKMVVAVAVVFITCYSPMSLLFVGMLVKLDLAVGGPYTNTVCTLGGTSFLFESANSSINIFIYYHMSSKYRATFRQLFSKKHKNENLPS